jgi:hypothetical protein
MTKREDTDRPPRDVVGEFFRRAAPSVAFLLRLTAEILDPTEQPTEGGRPPPEDEAEEEGLAGDDDEDHGAVSVSPRARSMLG